MNNDLSDLATSIQNARDAVATRLNNVRYHVRELEKERAACTECQERLEQLMGHPAAAVALEWIEQGRAIEADYQRAMAAWVSAAAEQKVA